MERIEDMIEEAKAEEKAAEEKKEEKFRKELRKGLEEALNVKKEQQVSIPVAEYVMLKQKERDLELLAMSIMEDLELSLRLRKNKYYFKQINSEIITSSRRFLDKGIFKTMIQMQKLQIKYLCGKDINEINREYRDIR